MNSHKNYTIVYLAFPFLLFGFFDMPLFLGISNKKWS